MSQISGKSLAISTALVLVICGLLYGLINLTIGWFWAAKPLESDMEAVRQIETIGTMVARTESRFTESDSAVVTEYLVIDIQARNSKSALAAAVSSLESKNWMITAQNSSAWVQLQSQQWPNHLLTVEVPEDAPSPLRGEEYEKIWREAKATARDPGALVIASIRRTDV